MRGASERFADFLDRIDDYGAARDFPAVKGVSYLSVHLRFGTISIRTLAARAHARSILPGGDGASKWLAELVWRDFYAQLLWHFPHVASGAFKREYDGLAFRNDEGRFAAWCEGRTGYPIVDAAMRQLNATGYMHNRLRMIAASFLVKDLLVDWRRGERVFAERLIDFDLASNNGGWQWAASTGCDAQPWFRIFNPVTQSARFDPDGAFIRRYVPELVRARRRRHPRAVEAPAGAAAGEGRRDRPRLPRAHRRPCARAGAGACALPPRRQRSAAREPGTGLSRHRAAAPHRGPAAAASDAPATVVPRPVRARTGRVRGAYGP